MAEHTPVCDFGWKVPEFSLTGIDDKIHSLEELKGPNGTLVDFICNHCPYVKAVIDHLVRDASAPKELGVSTIAICSNNAARYPEDSFEQMRDFAAEHSFTFPYLHDETQDVARAYNAVCTPDNSYLELQYRGRLDESGREPGGPAVRRHLFDDLKGFLPDFATRVLEQQCEPLPLSGPFTRGRQRNLGEEMMRVIGFDFEPGRLDVSHHPLLRGRSR